MRNCVLIIEHDPSVSRFMQLKLEEEGFSCLIDNTGEAAVDLAGQRQVDLILLDPDEPLKGGHEILGKVRDQLYADHLPVFRYICRCEGRSSECRCR